VVKTGVAAVAIYGAGQVLMNTASNVPWIGIALAASGTVDLINKQANEKNLKTIKIMFERNMSLARAVT